MPTGNAIISKPQEDTVILSAGAALVRAGNKPVYVQTFVNGQRISTRVTGGALALFSAFDGKTIIFNLTDNRCSSVSSTIGAQMAFDTIVGQISEIHSEDNEPTTIALAKRHRLQQDTGGGITLLICDANYLRAMNRFRLTPVLACADYSRVLKTAVSIAYVRR